MATQIDYIVAAGVFILVIGFVLYFATDYLTSMRTSMSIMGLRSDAISLLSLAEREFENSTGDVKRIGLSTNAYRFWILLNNTQPNLVNQSLTPSDLSNELVEFNYGQMGFSANPQSTSIYENGTEIEREINGDTVSFVSDVDSEEEKWFAVYFDDDSNFTGSSGTVSGTNDVVEKIFAVEKISLIQYKKIQYLGSLNYEALRNTTGVKNFRITIADNSDDENILDYGGTAPREGNVVSINRYVLFQNETGGIRNGNLIVKVW